jgi:hypothetical protein
MNVIGSLPQKNGSLFSRRKPRGFIDIHPQRVLDVFAYYSKKKKKDFLETIEPWSTGRNLKGNLEEHVLCTMFRCLSALFWFCFSQKKKKKERNNTTLQHHLDTG